MRVLTASGSLIDGSQLMLVSWCPLKVPRTGPTVMTACVSPLALALVAMLLALRFSAPVAVNSARVRGDTEVAAVSSAKETGFGRVALCSTCFSFMVEANVIIVSGGAKMLVWCSLGSVAAATWWDRHCGLLVTVTREMPEEESRSVCGSLF